ncbi:MAG: hypothetical protein CMM47_04670 [Rhodospirillaceae bacterium]|nr:hypothetical protein [Rhodospirillaceae bacterium]
MGYVTISNWSITKWTDEMEEFARKELVPLVLSAGAKSVQFVRTQELNTSVITQYEDEAAATAAQVKIAEIRKKLEMNTPLTMVSANGGVVIASGP